MDKILQNWENFLNEQTEPYQRKMKAKHSRLKKRVIGHGGQKAGPPYTNKPSMERSKSAPPMGESLHEDQLVIEEHIVKQGKKYCLKSKKSNKNLGCYPTRAGAEKREKQVQYFKHVNEGLFDIFKKKAKQPEYTNYSLIEDNIYVGKRPIEKTIDPPHKEVLLDDAVNKFDTIFIVSDEQVDLLKKLGHKESDRLKFAELKDTADPKEQAAQIELMEKVANQVANTKGNVLVACSVGANRSAAIAARALMLRKGIKNITDDKQDDVANNIIKKIREERAKFGLKALQYGKGHKISPGEDLSLSLVKTGDHTEFINFIKNGPTSTLEESLRRVIRRLIREQHGRKRYT